MRTISQLLIFTFIAFFITALGQSQASNQGIGVDMNNLTTSIVFDKSDIVSYFMDCPVLGTPCDDFNSTTFDDMEDGNCNCIGIPCPEQGTACDDGNSTTFNDMQDGACNCIGTPCPDQGIACDDGNPTTFNDMQDGACNCIGTPCPEQGIVCDDGDPTTFNDQQDGACNCIGTPCPAAGTSCDDGNACTTGDVYDAACGCAGIEYDADGDGVCDAQDLCPGGDDNLDVNSNGIPDDCEICVPTVINFNDLETTWGGWNDGGSDCRRNVNDAPYAYSGDKCIRLRDNTSTSVVTSDNIDLTSFETLTVGFTYITKSMDNSDEDFWLQISLDGGLSFTTVEEWNLGDEFENGIRYFESVDITMPFTSMTKIRFRCDASGNKDFVYIDDLLISGCFAGYANPIPKLNMEVKEEIKTKDEEILLKKKDLVMIRDKDLMIYPNPASSVIFIRTELPKGEYDLNVIAMNGQIVQSVKLISEGIINQVELPVNQFENGVYFVNVRNEEVNVSNKIIISK